MYLFFFTGRWTFNGEEGGGGRGGEWTFLSFSITLHQFFAPFHPMPSRVSCASPVCLKENGKGLLPKCHVLVKEIVLCVPVNL